MNKILKFLKNFFAFNYDRAKFQAPEAPLEKLSFLIDPKETFAVRGLPDNKLVIWINFFLEEIGSPNILFKNWALYYHDQTIVCGNCYCLTRWEEKVYLGYEWDDIAHDTQGNIIPSG